MDTSPNKTSVLSPNYNLFLQNFNGFKVISPNQVDNDANFLVSSGNFTSDWAQRVSCTVNTATTFTFTAQNAYIKQTFLLSEPGRTYTFKFKMRAVTGNTAIRILHEGAASGDFTDIVITGVLTQYTVTFTGRATEGILYVGFMDVNAAGHGQHEVTECQVYRDDHDGNLVVTAAAYPSYGVRGGIPVFGYGGTGPTTHNYWQNGNGNRPMGTAYTIYASCFARFLRGSQYLIASNHPTLLNMIIAIGSAPNYFLTSYLKTTGAFRAGTVSVPAQQWCVLTCVFNGAASEIRVNKNPADVVTHAATPTIDRTQHGGDSYAGQYQEGEFHEIIIRSVADNTAQQDAIIEWMGCQVGLSL
jgi:hypothetical protein